MRLYAIELHVARFCKWAAGFKRDFTTFGLHIGPQPLFCSLTSQPVKTSIVGVGCKKPQSTGVGKPPNVLGSQGQNRPESRPTEPLPDRPTCK